MCHCLELCPSPWSALHPKRPRWGWSRFSRLQWLGFWVADVVGIGPRQYLYFSSLLGAESTRQCLAVPCGHYAPGSPLLLRAHQLSTLKKKLFLTVEGPLEQKATWHKVAAAAGEAVGKIRLLCCARGNAFGSFRSRLGTHRISTFHLLMSIIMWLGRQCFVKKTKENLGT